jgi:hypothetical protein
MTEPDTEQRLIREIARLEAERDRLLQAAPSVFYFHRVMMWSLSALMITSLLLYPFSLQPSPDERMGILLFCGVFVATLGYWSWRAWTAPPPTDRDQRAYSDRLDYEGNDSPRNLQARIDALRAQLVRENDAHCRQS